METKKLRWDIDLNLFPNFISNLYTKYLSFKRDMLIEFGISCFFEINDTTCNICLIQKQWSNKITHFSIRTLLREVE